MNTLRLPRRTMRWLAAAGVALASLTATSANAQLPDLLIDPPLLMEQIPGLEPLLPELPDDLAPDPGGDPDPDPVPEPLTIFFEKTGGQVSCDEVTYTLRWGLRGDPATIAAPGFAAFLAIIRTDFADQLPAGLQITDVQVTGDVTDGVGGPVPASVLSTSATLDDTVKLDDMRLSATDIDASGELNERSMTIRITAKIDQAAFPAATIVDNQGVMTLSIAGGGGGGVSVYQSHDPTEPDDGNPTTGEPTSIEIDVTDCDTPPPPGEEPCFEIVEGEVDCVPGGGAFIYTMPFGADMSGKLVELKTDTPGIVIAPASQFVPAGGGDLAWTITGALPGDVIHLIVVGVETYAGPAEGVGLCCTQEIELIIPADIDCPEEEPAPDIQVLKEADVDLCTEDGTTECGFTITVKNVGTAPYNGPIVLEEITAPGAAAVTSGPNAPWNCLPMVSPMMCTHPATTLNPGEQVQLTLGFTPGVGWGAPVIENCAEFDYTASGFAEPFGETDNDKACASIPLCIPGVHAECTPPDEVEEPEVDLTIRKIASPVMCSADRVCNWDIVIFNPTLETFDGPLTVKDEFTTHTPVSVNFEPTGPWVCSSDSATEFRCDHPGLTLVGGASTIITVEAVFEESDIVEVENCGDIVPFPGETNEGNNNSCDTAILPEPVDDGEPAMRITKTCDAAVAGAAISCRITVSNVGDAAPSGPVRVNDAAELIGAGTPVAIQTVSPDGPEWSCGAAPADTLACEISGAVMTPGSSRYFDVTLSVSPNESFENCARGSYGPAPGDDIVYPIGEACDTGGASLKVEKTGQAQCTAGEECSFNITFTNESDSDFEGQVRIGDALGVDGLGRLEGVEITSIEPPFGCAEEPTTLPLSCLADLELGAGESRTHVVTVVIPEAAIADATGPLTGQNCVAVLSPDTPVLGTPGRGVTSREISIDPTGLGDAYSCHTFSLLKQEIQEQTKECAAGFVLNDDGRCVCPAGTTFRNGKCAGEPTTVPLPDPRPQTDPVPETEQCTLLPGMIRTRNGNCVCPKGTELRNGSCRQIVVDEEPPVRQCTLLPGQIRTKDGKCVCPARTKLVNGKCTKIVVDETPPVRQCTLLPGQIRTKDGKCVCPARTSLKNGKCVKNTVSTTEPPVRQCKLLPGQIRTKDGKCVCPARTSLKNGKCVKNSATVPGIKVIPGIKIQPGIVPDIKLPNRDTGKKVAPKKVTPKVVKPKTQILKVRPGTTLKKQ